MIIGHQKQWRFLKKITENGNIPHAFLFAGQEKLGKKKVAFEWISTLFNQEIGNIHPDLQVVEPVGKEIEISQIKGLINGLSLKPYSAPLKAALIDNAHLMNSEAQSCLLKTLEEPKGNTLLILVTDQPSSLLPTILSRVQTVKFYPVGKEEMGSLDCEFAGGSPGQALEFKECPEKKTEFEKRMREIEDISKSDLYQRFDYVKNLTEGETDLKGIIRIWMSYFRSQLLSRISKRENANKIKSVLKSLQEADYLVSRTNVNPRLLLETLMIEL
jgi:DNA polymerase-3 subunit delta'